MTIDWRVHMHPEVVRYLFRLRWEGTEIRQAIAKLQAGPPPDASETKEAGIYLWVEARHWITFKVESEEQAIYITAVQHIEERK